MLVWRLSKGALAFSGRSYEQDTIPKPGGLGERRSAAPVRRAPFVTDRGRIGVGPTEVTLIRQMGILEGLQTGLCSISDALFSDKPRRLPLKEASIPGLAKWKAPVAT